MREEPGGGQGDEDGQVSNKSSVDPVQLTIKAPRPADVQ